MADDARADHHRPTTTITPYVTRPGRSTLRSTFQHASDVIVGDGYTPDQVLAGAVCAVLDWLESKFPQALPLQARDLEGFELDHHGQQQLHCVSIPEDGLWSARLVQPDAPFRNRPAVAGRTWTTELALHRSDSGVRFAVRIFCASAPYATEPIALTRPRVVIDLAQRFGLREVRPLDGRPWMLESKEDLRALYDLLIDRRRSMPVVLLTQPNPRDWPGKVAPFVLEHEELARRTQGFAHIACMPRNLGYAWTEMVGKIWSAFWGAVRTYQPGLDLENDLPSWHPRVLPDRILFWRYNGLEGEGGFTSFLLDKLLEHAATKNVDWGGCLFFADARSRRAALARERIKREVQEQRSHVDEVSALRAQIDEVEKIYEEEIESLQEQVKQLAGERDVALQMGEAAESDRNRLIEENRKLQFLNDTLRTAIEKRTGRSADAELRIPNNYEDMPEWVEQHLAGRLVLHPRAHKGIKDKNRRYEDVALVYRALLLLAQEYRNMMMGHDGAKAAFELRCQELELELDGSITKSRAGEEGETYFVTYPSGSSQSRFLEWHLRKGNSREARYCLRVYFFWDEQTQRVVVGWLPSHLNTRTT